MHSIDIDSNIKARKDADEIGALYADSPTRFWEVLRKICDEHLPPPPAPVDRLPAMTEQEAIHFESVAMPWGNHYGRPVGETPCYYLIFLTEGDEFSKRLKRYVKSKRFQDRQEDVE